MGTSFLTLACVLAFCAPAHALTLEFPGPATVTATVTARSSYALPTDAWANGRLPADTIDGQVERAAWEIDTEQLSSLDLMQPLRAQLLAAGFKPVFECETESCGGFDFRFAIDVLPEPEMHVDLGDYRFLSVRNGDEAIGLLVSRSASKGFVQMTRAVADTGAQMFAATNLGTDSLGSGQTIPLSATNRPALLPTLGTPMAGLMTGGSVVLEGLDFGTGAAELTDGRYPSLAALADWLKANPDKTVALVGHTDASGGLDGNIVVSKRRATSVRARLMQAYGVPATQLDAQGVGYLAPIASNLTEEGRQKNRRVEAILTSTQ